MDLKHKQGQTGRWGSRTLRGHVSAGHLVGLAATPTEGGRHGKTLQTSPMGWVLQWQLVLLQFPARRAQPQAGTAEGGRWVLLQKLPTPGDDRLPWQCLLVQGKAGHSEGRRNFWTAGITVGMLAATTALFLRPGWWNTLSASNTISLVCPSPDVFHAHRDVCTKDHHGHETWGAEEMWAVRSSENDPVLLRPVPPQRAVERAEAAVLLLLLLGQLHEHLRHTQGMRMHHVPPRNSLGHKQNSC